MTNRIKKYMLFLGITSLVISCISLKKRTAHAIDNTLYSTFFENQTIFQKNQSNTNLGTGLAYLFSKNLQINSSARLLVEGKSKGFYAGFGVSYRINKHKDSFKELDENGREVKDTPISKYNKKQKGFFSRLFSIFTKKKNKKTKRSRNNKNEN